MNQQKISLVFLIFVSFFSAKAQILDDSTKQVYDYKTTKFFLEDDVLNNHKTLYTPDTTINTFHLSNFNQRSYWQYQDLGSYGTASKPMYYTPIAQVSTDLGLSVYTPFAFNAQKVQYFDTKSPFTNLYYVQGASGQNNIRFTHARNITKKWNIGFDVNRVNSVKQFAATSTSNVVDSWSFMVFSSYESKNKKYEIVGNYNHFNHFVIDQGGVYLNSSFKNDYFYDSKYESRLVLLTKSHSRDKRNEFHIYHQYKLTNGLQLFQTIDYQSRNNTFEDNNFSDSLDRSFYREAILPSLSASYNKNFIKPNAHKDSLIQQYTNYKLLETKVGIKGFYKGFNYRLSLRERLYKYQQTKWEDGTHFFTGFTNGVEKTFELYKTTSNDNGGYKNEVLLGGWASYYFPDSVRKVIAEAEFNNLGVKGSYVKGEYYSNFLKLGFSVISSPPTLLQNNFYGNVMSWQRNFNNVFSSNFYGSLDYKVGKFRFQPNATYSFIKNYIYFNDKFQPFQDSTTLGNSILHLGLGIEFRNKRFSIINQVDYATTSSDFIRIPTLSINSRIAYEFIYSKVLHINTGVEIYYKSAYKADGYMPLTQQFYVQNTNNVWGAAVADVFADFKIRRVRIFLKMSNINQGFNRNIYSSARVNGHHDGYFTTPYYLSLRRGFNLGINWPLFD